MNVNFIFSLAVSLDFTVRFAIDSSKESEDYFIFSAENVTAHLYRRNATLKLFLRTNSSYRQYEANGANDIFDFTWEDFLVDEQPMTIVKSQGQMGYFKFDGYTFVSPIYEIWNHQPAIAVQEPVFQCEGQNYGLIVLIVVVVGLLLKFDIIVPRIVKEILKSYEVSEEGEREASYVEMCDV